MKALPRRDHDRHGTKERTPHQAMLEPCHHLPGSRPWQNALDTMKTVVYQSYWTRDVPAWMFRCMQWPGLDGGRTTINSWRSPQDRRLGFHRMAQPANYPVLLRKQVDLAALVETEPKIGTVCMHDLQDRLMLPRVYQRQLEEGCWLAIAQSIDFGEEDAPGRDIAKKVLPLQSRDRLAATNESTGDGQAQPMSVLERGIRQALQDIVEREAGQMGFIAWIEGPSPSRRLQP